MVSIFNFDNYRKFIAKRFQEMPKQGYGQSRKLAAFLNVHTTLVSQVLKNLKDFTLEQASLTCEFLGLNEGETQLFLLLVQYERAGNESLRRNLRRQIENAKSHAKELVNRLESKKKLSEEDRATFYSDWSYSAVRQLVAIKGFAQTDAIGKYLGLSIKRVRSIVDFLLATGLCIEENGQIKVGPRSTHLESSSPWVRVHHINWRQKAIEQIHSDELAKLHYSCPMTISSSDALKIREMIVQFLQTLDQVIEPSISEELRCINIDWFKI